MVLMIGLFFMDNNKLEIGFDYCYDKVGSFKSRYSFWWVVNWYYSFGN